MATAAPDFQRYAVYYVPNGDALARFGAAWLGWDITTGTTCAHPDNLDLDIAIAHITASPRRYGLHATIVPPFRLADGMDQPALEQLLSGIAAASAPVELNALELARLGRFLALVPEGAAEALNRLAAFWLVGSDPMRAPPLPADLERHRARPLTPAQDALLNRWGYPYVMEAFKCHITLTGKLPKAQARAVADHLEPVLAPLLPRPFRIRQLALVGEDRDGWFHVIRQYDLGAKA